MLKIRLLMMVLLTALFADIVSAIPTACPATPALFFWSGAVGSVSEGLSSRLRAEPSLEAEILANLSAGSLFTVQAEPVCADDLRWWPVIADNLTGWLAEGSATGDYYIQPTDSEAPIIDNSARIAIWGMGQPSDIAWTSDARTMAIASTSGLWIYANRDFQTEPRLLSERSQNVISAAFDPANPNALYAANGDRSLSRWDLTAGSVERLGRFDADISSINFSNTGQFLSVRLASGEINLLPLANFANLVKIPAQDSLAGLYTSAAFSHDETMLALGTDAGSVEIFDIQGQRLMSFSLPDRGAAIVSFSPDDSLLAAASRSGQTIRIWNLEQQTLVVEKSTGEQVLDNLFFLSSGQLLTVQSLYNDRMVLLYSGSTFESEEPYYGLGYLPQPDGSTMTFFKYHEYNSHLVSIMAVNPERFFDGAVELTRFITTPEFILSSDGSRLIYESVDGFNLIDTQTNTLITQIPHSPSLTIRYTLSPDARYFAACVNQDTLSWQPVIEVYDLTRVDAAGTALNILSPFDNPDLYGIGCDMLSFVSTPDGERLVTNHLMNGASLVFWDFTNEQAFTFQALLIPNTAAFFASDTLLRGTKFIINHNTDASLPYSAVTVDVYDSLELATAPRTITVDWVRGNRYYWMLNAILISDTTLAVTAGYEGRDLALYNLTSLTETQRIPTPSAIDAIAVTTDGRWIATAHKDGIIRLWNTEQLETPIILGKISETLNRLMFSPDSQRLYLNGSTWDVSTITDGQ